MTTTQTRSISKTLWESKWRSTSIFKTLGSQGASRMILISITTILARGLSRRSPRTTFATQLSRSRMITQRRPASSSHPSLCRNRHLLNQKALRTYSRRRQNSRNCSRQSTTRASRAFWKTSTGRTLHPIRTLIVQPHKSRSKSKTTTNPAALSQWKVKERCLSRTVKKISRTSESNATITSLIRRSG